MSAEGPTMVVRCYETADEKAVVDLWHRCGLVVPWNDPQEDIALKLRVQPELFLVGAIATKVVASVMVGWEGHRGWINYLAVEPGEQRHGLGRQIMAEAEARLRCLGCPKINLQVRSTNQAVIAFYERLGYKVEDRVSMGKLLRKEL
jgi:ribosomal protein S18 acetylase RimI-like enzyme